MADRTITEISATMRDLDFCMMTTRSDDGLAARPMSNNREVDYDGDSWFFSDESSRTVQDLRRDPTVGLTYQGPQGEGGRPGIFLAIEGKAELTKDRAALAEHWQEELKRWWPEGIDSPEITLIKVVGDRLHYWDGGDEGEILL